jgi:hypothetical protein
MSDFPAKEPIAFLLLAANEISLRVLQTPFPLQ